MTTVIGLHGDQGAGKDEVGKILVEKHGFSRLAFADRLKEMCEKLNPIVGHTRGLMGPMASPIWEPVRLVDAVVELGWDEAKRRYPEVRRTQQYLATDVVRDMIDYDYWLDYVRNQIKPGGDYVITDVRFPNEGAMITGPNDWLSGWLGDLSQIWWITRKDNPHVQANAHVSEQWHPESYIPIINDGTLADLGDFVSAAVNGEIKLCSSPLVD